MSRWKYSLRVQIQDTENNKPNTKIADIKTDICYFYYSLTTPFLRITFAYSAFSPVITTAYASFARS